MSRVCIIALLSAILVLEAFLSRAVTGSVLHQALLPAAALAIFLARWIGRKTTVVAGWLIAVGVAAGGWRMMRMGLAPVSLSELPAAFHLAVGVHLWWWMRGLGDGRPVSSEIFGLWARGWAVVAGALVVWSLGSVEIYGSSVFVARVGAMAVLAASVALASMAGERRGPRVSAGGAVATAGIVVLAAWSQSLGDGAANLAYRWLERNRNATELDKFGMAEAAFAPVGGALDGAMRELPRRLDLRLDDSVRFHLQIDDPGEFREATRLPLYVRTSALAVFAGGGRLGPRRIGGWIYDSDDGTEDGVTLLADASPGSGGESMDYWVLIGREEARGLPLMPATRAVGLAGVYAFAEGWYQLALKEHQRRVRFRGRAALVRWSTLRQREGIAVGDAPAGYLQLPVSALADRIRVTADEVAPGKRDLSSRLAGIEKQLARQCRYSLKYENPDDLDPVENFLYGERLGHCELYAAGTVMLLRASGVPSRIAFGFCGGESDPAQGLIAFRQSDYHAWAEIFLRDHGWVVFDTTPDGMGAARAAVENPNGAAFASIDPSAYEDLGGERFPGSYEVSRFAKFAAAAIDWSARWLPVIFGAGGVVMLGIWWRRGRSAREAGAAGESGVSSVGRGATKDRLPGLWEDYLKACAASGMVKAPGQTLGEFLEALKNSGFCGDELDELVAYLYGIRYAGAEPDKAREREFRLLIRTRILA